MLRYKAIIISIIFLVLFNFTTETSPSSKEELAYNSICIDIGHGGIDPGTIYKKIYEKDINLKIGLELGKLLEEESFKVTYTRTTDKDLAPKNYKERKKTDLTYRARIINKSDCFMYLSIHLNSSPSKSIRGPQIYYDDINKENKILATSMYKTFKKQVSSTRKIQEIKDLYMFKLISKPGVLAELGYLSNAGERGLLIDTTYQKKLANILKDSITDYQITILNQ